ncbi:MAG: hypothetical protein KA144_08745 [Xanthomonadaceae bacterium]|nr:hypothetical protein [Xanthomonadaceae bacterium]
MPNSSAALATASRSAFETCTDGSFDSQGGSNASKGASRSKAIQYSSVISAAVLALPMPGAGGISRSLGSGPCSSCDAPASGLVNFATRIVAIFSAFGAKTGVSGPRGTNSKLSGAPASIDRQVSLNWMYAALSTSPYSLWHNVLWKFPMKGISAVSRFSSEFGLGFAMLFLLGLRWSLRCGYRAPQGGLYAHRWAYCISGLTGC